MAGESSDTGHMTVFLEAGDPSKSPLCLEVFAAMLKDPET